MQSRCTLDQTSWKTCTEGALLVKQSNQLSQSLSTTSEINPKIHTNYRQLSKKVFSNETIKKSCTHVMIFKKLYKSIK